MEERNRYVLSRGTEEPKDERVAKEKKRDKDRPVRSRKRPNRQIERGRENEEEIKEQERKQGVYRVFDEF